MLARLFDFAAAGDGRMVLGDQPIAVVGTGEVPSGMIPLRLDHVAFATDDADATHVRLAAQGARLAGAFTPDGPRDIPEFRAHGVRFVFFDGPEGWPLEFCATNGVARHPGHDHYAIRTAELDATEARLAALGAGPIARHVLAGAAGPVHVRFLSLGNHTFELFDDAPGAEHRSDAGWIGVL
jgi:catechol 2,3-dioxygenase-like lactoylglutathione lyase family enzyme